MAIKMSGLSSGMDTESIVSELMSAQRLKSTKIENSITKLEWKKDTWKALNNKIYSLYTGPLAKLKMEGSFNTRKATSSNEDKVTVTANSSTPSGEHLLRIEQLASAQFETSNQLGLDINSKAITASTKLTDLGMTAGSSEKITVDAGGTVKTLTISDTSTVNDFLTTLKDAGLNASYDTTQKRFFISSKDSGSAFSITPSGTVDLSKLKLAAITKTDNGDGTYDVGGGVNPVKPTIAKFVYNGVEMTSASNNVTVNGLNLVLKKVTSDGADNVNNTLDDEKISLNVTNDDQAVYDMVKSFVKSYNDVLEELNKVYNADTAKGYDPLTDKQKEAMTDDQVKSWEDKIKNSLLRRDSSVESIITTMKSKFNSNVKVGNDTYNLSSFGIGTTNYNEKGKLHIKGDKEDTDTLGETDKLLAAIKEKPEVVAEVFTELASNLYQAMTDKMRSTSLNSALNFYNDKEMNKTLKEYKGGLSTLEKRLSDMEARYYKQFTALEKTMSNLNSQNSSLASLLGTSNS